MTKTLITIVIIAAVLLGGWQMFMYWDKVQNEKEDERKAAAAKMINPDNLGGLPYQLDASLRVAQKQGVDGLGQWLKNYGRNVQDPRKAWIELDYCVMLSRKNPQEARRIFATVKQRTPPSSPVYARVQELAKGYE
jgi:hypothetical protein